MLKPFSQCLFRFKTAWNKSICKFRQLLIKNVSSQKLQWVELSNIKSIHSLWISVERRSWLSRRTHTKINISSMYARMGCKEKNVIIWGVILHFQIIKPSTPQYNIDVQSILKCLVWPSVDVTVKAGQCKNCVTGKSDTGYVT